MKRLLIITVLALMLLSGCTSTGESTETTTKETTSQPETDGTKEGDASDFVELQGDGSGSVTETYSNITFDVPDSWEKKRTWRSMKLLTRRMRGY